MLNFGVMCAYIHIVLFFPDSDSNTWYGEIIQTNRLTLCQVNETTGLPRLK